MYARACFLSVRMCLDAPNIVMGLTGTEHVCAMPSKRSDAGLLAPLAGRAFSTTAKE